MPKRILEGLRILLAEEEALVAMDIEQMCYEHGAAEVHTVSTGSALEAFKASEAEDGMLDVDAAILDANVGGVWTGALARHLREHGIPFVFATGYARDEPFFAEFPEIAVIMKPYLATELITGLAAAIRRARSGG